MKKFIYSVCVLLLVTTSGCKDNGAEGQPVAAAGPPPLPVQEIYCSTLSFAKTSDVDALPGGIWRGALSNCAQNTSHYVTALVTEDGRFRILGEDGHLLRGSLQTDGNTFNGNGVDFARAGTEYFSGPTTALFVQGSVQERSALYGRWGTEWGSYRYFSFYGTEHAIFKLDELFRKEQPRQYKEKDDGDQPFYKRESKKSAVPHSFGQGLLRVSSSHLLENRY